METKTKPETARPQSVSHKSAITRDVRLWTVLDSPCSLFSLHRVSCEQAYEFMSCMRVSLIPHRCPTHQLFRQINNNNTQHFIIIIMGMFLVLGSREQIIWRWEIIKSLFMLLYAQKWKINSESNVIDVNAKWKSSLQRMFSRLFFHLQHQSGRVFWQHFMYISWHIHPPLLRLITHLLFSFTPWVFPFSDEHKNGDDDDADVASRPFSTLGGGMRVGIKTETRENL